MVKRALEMVLSAMGWMTEMIFTCDLGLALLLVLIMLVHFPCYLRLTLKYVRRRSEIELRHLSLGWHEKHGKTFCQWKSCPTGVTIFQEKITRGTQILVHTSFTSEYLDIWGLLLDELLLPPWDELLGFFLCIILLLAHSI